MNMFFRTRYYAHAVVIGISILLLWSACKTKTTENTINSFQVIQPQVKDTVIYMAYVAQINAVQNVEIRSRNSGFLEKLWVDEGQPVKQGQVLFSISSKEFQQQLKQEQKSVLNESVTTADELFRNGKAAYLEILFSQQNALKTEIELLEINKRVKQTRINLYKAIGGGWN